MILIYKVIRYFSSIKSKLYKNFLKKSFASGGDSVIFYGSGSPVIRGEANIYLGKSVKINEFAYFYARKEAKITIGDNCNIGSFAKFITSSYDLDKWLNSSDFIGLDIHVEKDIVIGNHCRIANGATILPGVELKGKNIVVAAGSVVTKSFCEDNIVIGGVPASIIKRI